MIVSLDNTYSIKKVNLIELFPINCHNIILSKTSNNELMINLNQGVSGLSYSNWRKTIGKYLIKDLRNLINGVIECEYYKIYNKEHNYLCKLINSDILNESQSNTQILEKNNIYFLVVNNFSYEDTKSLELFEDIIPEIKPNEIEEEDKELINDYDNSISLFD